MKENEIVNSDEINIKLSSNDNLRKIMDFYLSDERTCNDFKNILVRTFIKGNFEIAKMLLSMNVIDINAKYIHNYFFINEI